MELIIGITWAYILFVGLPFAARAYIDHMEEKDWKRAWRAAQAETKRWNALTHLEQLEEELAKLKKT